MPWTAELAVTSIVVAAMLGISAGLLAALHHNQRLDVLISALMLFGISMPGFWLGLMLILFFGVVLGVLPAGGRGTVWHLILPAFTLGYFTSAAILRLTRSAMLEVLGSDYIKFARLKGLHEQVVLWKHGLKNAVIPVVTVLGLQVAQITGGAVIIETIFGIPGMGQFLVEAILQRDYPVIQGINLLIVIIIVATNLLVDLTYALLDPRIRY